MSVQKAIFNLCGAVGGFDWENGRITGWHNPTIPQPADADVNRELLKGLLEDSVQSHLDEVARSKGYDNCLSCVSYQSSSNPVFAAEARAMTACRDAVWTKCYQVMAAVQAGTRPIPDVAQLIFELPAIVW